MIKPIVIKVAKRTYNHKEVPSSDFSLGCTHVYDGKKVMQPYISLKIDGYTHYIKFTQDEAEWLATHLLAYSKEGR